MSTIRNQSWLQDVLVRGAPLPVGVQEFVSDCTVSLGFDQVTQLSLVLEDPEWTTMTSGALTRKTSVDYQGLRLRVAAISLDGGKGGRGGIAVDARSEPVQALKERRGPLVMSNTSPTGFVRAEAAAVGLRVVAEETPVRPQVARDVPDPLQPPPTGADTPSSWTTIRRLAEEVGFIAFEWENILVFARPSWLVRTRALGPIVYTGWLGARPEHLPLNPPEARWSEDNGKISLSMTLPAERQTECRPGKALNLGGVPGFDGEYMIESVAFSPALLTGVDITCGLPIDPTPRPPEPAVEPGSGGAGTGGAGAPDVLSVGGAGGTASQHVSEFVNLCLKQAGKTYIFGAEARFSDPSPRAFDCSELIEWALARVGVRFPDGSSNQRAAMRKIPLQQAIRTRGALLWKPGHIAVSLGDGRTIEARGRKYGVLIGRAGDIRFTEGGLVPGLRY